MGYNQREVSSAVVGVALMNINLFYVVSCRSRADFDEGAFKFRLSLPRFSANFLKNISLVDAFETIVKKHKATISQVALTWILASHPTCACFPFRSLRITL